MRKGFVPTVDFSEFCMSEARIISPELTTPSQKTVCTVLQQWACTQGTGERAAPFFPQTRAAASLKSKVACWPAAWLTAVQHLPYGPPLTAPVASADIQLPRAQLWPPNHCTKAIGLAWMLPSASPGHAAMIWETKGSIPQRQAPCDSALCPVDVSIKQMIHASVHRHKCATQSRSLKLKEQSLQLRTLMT